MAEIKLEVPKELEVGAKMLGKEELSRIVCEALKEQLSEELMFKLADELLRIDEVGFMFLFSLLERKIEIYPEEKYEQSLSEAEKLSPHGKDVHKDDPYFAFLSPDQNLTSTADC